MSKKKQYKKKVNPNEERMKGLCRTCEGTGYVQSEDGSHTVDCPDCFGSGKYINPYAKGG